jgi:hypothetical protein
MPEEVEELKKSIDSWIKKAMSDIKGIDANWKVVNDNVANINHNYELMLELKEDIKKIEDEINLLKAAFISLTCEKKNE